MMRKKIVYSFPFFFCAFFCIFAAAEMKLKSYLFGNDSVQEISLLAEKKTTSKRSKREHKIELNHKHVNELTVYCSLSHILISCANRKMFQMSEDPYSIYFSQFQFFFCITSIAVAKFCCHWTKPCTCTVSILVT